MPSSPAIQPFENGILTLEIRGLGPVVSFKNSKVLLVKNPKTGEPLKRPMLVTKGEYKKQMRKIVESFVLQLLCASQTIIDGTGTALLRRSLIASLLPEDDSLNEIPEFHVYVERVEEGQEGALIEIQRIG
jgi:hypothetical protein